MSPPVHAAPRLRSATRCCPDRAPPNAAQLPGACVVAGRFQYLHLCHRTVRYFRQMLVQHLPDLCFGHDSKKMIHRSTILEQHDRRQAANAELLRQLLLLVRVDLREPETAAIFCSQSVEHGISCLQGPHQGAQKSTSDRDAGRSFDDIGHEGAGGDCALQPNRLWSRSYPALMKRRSA